MVDFLQVFVFDFLTRNLLVEQVSEVKIDLTISRESHSKHASKESKHLFISHIMEHWIHHPTLSHFSWLVAVIGSRDQKSKCWRLELTSNLIDSFSSKASYIVALLPSESILPWVAVTVSHFKTWVSFSHSSHITINMIHGLSEHSEMAVDINHAFASKWLRFKSIYLSPSQGSASFHRVA